MNFSGADDECEITIISDRTIDIVMGNFFGCFTIKVAKRDDHKLSRFEKLIEKLEKFV